MRNPKKVAENATMQSFINCYMRETGNYEEFTRVEQFSELVSKSNELDKTVKIPLVQQQMDIIVPIQYWSRTDRHLFQFPIYSLVSDQLKTLDYVTVTSLIVKELLMENGKEGAEDELVLRVILSCQKIQTYIEKREDDAQELTNEEFDFIDAEQSLLFGHLLHPTPKSKQGITDKADQEFSPEYKNDFQLHYFSAEQSLVLEDSAREVSAGDIVFEDLRGSSDVDGDWMEEQIKKERVLLPVHPLQVPSLLEKTKVQTLLSTGELEYVGPLGKSFTATSSFRTLYSPESKFMYKFSVPVKITNSLRVNQAKELARGVEVSNLIGTEIGEKLGEVHPNFNIIQDPAYLNLDSGEDVSGFEVVIRENPFYEKRENASVVAALGQDHAYGGQPRIHSIIKGISDREKRTLEEVSLDWFEQYLSRTVDPMLWLFDTYGIALEAHQQNSVIQLKNGYPDLFYYRDNQGYYFCQSKAEQLRKLLPSLNEASDTICDDEVAEERLRYYFFFNHLFGLINSFGTSGLIEEEKLLNRLRERLKKHKDEKENLGDFLEQLLNQSALPCKANLLTRFYDMDELVGPMEAQSVYTHVNNPLFEEVNIPYVL